MLHFWGNLFESSEAPILWPPDAKSWLIGKHHDAGKDWGQKKGAAEDEMVGWHHWLNGHEFEQTPGDSEGQESLACCSPWSDRGPHDIVTEQQHCFQGTDAELHSLSSSMFPFYLIHSFCPHQSTSCLDCTVSWPSIVISDSVNKPKNDASFTFSFVFLWKIVPVTWFLRKSCLNFKK